MSWDSDSRFGTHDFHSTITRSINNTLWKQRVWFLCKGPTQRLILRVMVLPSLWHTACCFCHIRNQRQTFNLRFKGDLAHHESVASLDQACLDARQGSPGYKIMNGPMRRNETSQLSASHQVPARVFLFGSKSVCFPLCEQHMSVCRWFTWFVACA